MKIYKDAAVGRSLVRTVSAAALVILLFSYLVVTITGTNRMAEQVKLISEHPFTVSGLTNQMLIDMGKLQLSAEKLRTCDSDQEMEEAKNYGDTLYLGMDQNISQIQHLYLGSKESMGQFTVSYSELKLEWNAFLEYIGQKKRSEQEVERYIQAQLSPIYEQYEHDARNILDFATLKQQSFSDNALSLKSKTIYWSLLIAFVCLSGTLFFLRLTDRLNMAVEAKNKQFDLLGRTVDEAFLLFEKESKSCYYVSENSERLLGVCATELLKDRKQFYRYMSGESRNALESHVAQDAPQYVGEELLVCGLPGNSEAHRLCAKFFSVRQDDGKIVCVVTVSDITEDVKAQAALRDALTSAQNANNAKRDFLSHMSHEIRTPMNAIIGMTTIAAANMETPARVENCLEKISQASKHLLLLINDILDMSRIESNKVTLNLEPFDIYQFISNVSGLVYEQAKQKNLELSERVTGFDRHTVYSGDSMRINQVLLNLMSNAVKFTPPGGRVGLEVICIPMRGKYDKLRFVVSDTGIGMSEEVLKRIYTPFEQADVTIAQKYGGSGLGMSIAKNLVSLMGGHIHAESVEGKGSILTVELVLERNSKDGAAAFPGDLDSMKVLIVDGEPDICEHMALLLGKISIKSEWTLSGREALNLLVAANDGGVPFDICFIDLNVPDLDGIETTREIRRRIGKESPLIIISAYDWGNLEKEAREAGADAFIVKPLFLSSIYDTLVRVTRGSFTRISRDEGVEKTLTGKKILLAEDNELNMEIAVELLKMSGVSRVECARDGKQIVDIFMDSKEGEYDAILMDIQMPLKDGYTASEEIRASAHPDAKKIAIIATTANAFSEDVSAALAAGMDAHVGKPIDMNRLSEVIKKVVERKKRQEIS